MYRSPLRLSLAFALLGLAAPAGAQGPLTDVYGDPLPPGALARLGTVRFRHDGGLHWSCPLHAVAYSPDGKLLASAGEDRTVRTWDALTGKPGVVLRLSGVPKALAFAPDNRALAFAGTGGELGLADVASGKVIQRFTKAQDDVLAVAFSGDGKTLASAGADKTVRLWDCATGRELFVFRGHEDAVFWIAFIGKDTVVSGSADGSVRFWAAATGKEGNRFQGQPKSLKSLALSPDGRTLAIGGMGETLLLWDARKGHGPQLSGPKPLGRGNNAPFSGLAFSPDGQFLVAVSYLGYEPILVWHVATAKQVPVVRSRFESGTVAFAPDGKTFAVANYSNTLRFWDLKTGQERLPAVGPGSGVRMVAVSPDGSKVATAGSNTYLWDAHTGKLLHSWDTARQGIQNLTFSPDGQTLAGAVNEYDIHLWNVATGKSVGKLEWQGPSQYHGIPARSLVFSADGKSLVVVGSRVRVYDVAAGKHSRDLLPQGDYFAALAPDGRTLAVPGSELITLLDLPTGKALRQFGLGGKYAYARFLRNGAVLLTVDPVGKVSLWETKPGGKLLRQITLPLHTRYAASRDGRFVAGGSGGEYRNTPEARLVYVWEVATGQEVAQLDGHTGQVEALAFTPDGRRLVSGSSDGTALVWDLTGRVRDGKLPPAVLDAKALATAWQDLAGDKALRAHRAVWALVACPDKSVPLLAERLRFDPKDTALAYQRIMDLADDEEKIRARAVKELLALGAVAVPALQKTLQGKPPIQVRERVTQLLKQLELVRVAELHRQLRATLILEQVGSQEARAVLQELARGGIYEAVQQEALAGLERLTAVR